MTSECLTIDYTKSTELTNIELRILQQYQGLARRLNKLSEIISNIAQTPTDELLENLREIEGKISLVYTLFNAAVYSLFLQRDNNETLNTKQQQVPQEVGINRYHDKTNEPETEQTHKDEIMQESTQSFIV